MHLPFCAGACDYCDFYSIPVSPEDGRVRRYTDALIRDAGWLRRDFGVTAVPTAYIGGGTPSLLGAGGIGRLLSGLAGLWDAPPAELTVEANPESADEGFLRACRDGGATRISLGVQTFHQPSRDAVHRIGAAPDAGLERVRRIFGSRFSADIITGLPFQTEAVLLSDIRRLLVYEPEHISLYALTVEPGTPLAAPDRKRLLPDPDSADGAWIAGRDALEQAGYEQYEVSNFALPGKRGAHNIRYWRMENWLGLGSGGSSTIIDELSGTGRRLTFAPDVPAYIAGAAPEAELLDRLTLIKETLLMGFRYIDGPDTALFYTRFGRTLEACIPQTLGVWRAKGLLRPEKTALTPQGLLFLDAFLRDAFGEVASYR